MSDLSLNNVSQQTLKKGKYQHYKGAQYEVIGTAWHSETEELMVVYRPLYGKSDLWVRPFDMFNETVIFDGKKVKRFELIKPILNN